MVVKPLHFPTAIEAIVPIYNIPKAPILYFTGEVLAGIFSGHIRNWYGRRFRFWRSVRPEHFRCVPMRESRQS